MTLITVSFSFTFSFAAKLSWKKNFFFEKIFVFYKIYIICRGKVFYMEKKVLKRKVFKWKNINENVKNICLISEIYYYTENVCVSDKT